MEKSNGGKNGVRPIPQLMNTSRHQLFSKKSLKTPASRKVPPRPPSKPLPPSFFGHISTDKAQSVSFKSDSSTLSKDYDKNKDESYFDQCFQIINKLGSGDFGDVYKVKSRTDGKCYAIKKSRERFKGRLDRQRKLEEVAKHETLPKHPNFVTFFKAWEERQYLYIQTELCEISLSDYLDYNHDISESKVWNYLVDLLLAVEHLHDTDLIHLDIKPDNILISSDGFCKLGDFGLVVDLKKNEQNEATEGDPKYLAKELMQGVFTKAADIFSVGITIFELACDLDLPSGGEGWHKLRDGEVLEQVLQSHSHLSKPLMDIIMDMMNPDYTKRPTAKSLLNKPNIRKYARYRRWELKATSLRNYVKNFLTTFLHMFLKLSFLSFAYNLINRIFFNSDYESAISPGIASNLSSPRGDNSFSDDEVFENSILSPIENVSLNSSVKVSTTKRSLNLRSNRKQPITSTNIKPSTPMRRYVHSQRDSPTTFNTSLDRSYNNESLSQRLSFYDLSDDEGELNITEEESIIGPKNLLSVFEEMESEEKSVL